MDAADGLAIGALLLFLALLYLITTDDKYDPTDRDDSSDND
jgi:hypothetical protein